MTNNIKLNEVRQSEKYNFSYLYNKHKNTDDDTYVSPMCYNATNCDYTSQEQFIDSYVKQNQKHLSAFTLNCRSLSAHWDEYKDLLSDLSSPSFSFDLLGITELFNLPPDQSYDLHGYQKLKCKNRNPNESVRGGVGLFVKENILCKDRDDLTVFIPHVIETIFIEIEVTNSKNIIVGIIYRPNTYPKADINIFMETILNLIEVMNHENKTILLMGDFNIDLLNFESHPQTNFFIDNMISLGLIPLITKPTRISKESATLIDHIYTNKINSSATSGIILTDIADHFGVFTLLSNNIPKKSSPSIEYRSFKNENTTYFNQLLSNYEYANVMNIDEVNEAYANFIDVYTNCFEQAFPLKKTNPQNKYIRKEPWMTDGLLVSSNHKKKLFKIKLHKPTDINILRYKNYCTVFNSVRRKRKKIYYTELLQTYKKDSKRTWSILKNVIQKSKMDGTLPSTFLINRNLVSNKKEIANGFNEFFTNIGKNLADSILETGMCYTRHLQNNNNRSFFMSPVTPDEIISIVKTLKPKTSKGHDEISTKLIKDSIHHIAIPLAHVINLSISSGTVPSQMKIARIIPIFKSGNAQLFNNYRPISILPSFSKILEKVMFKQVSKFLYDNNILYKHQYGFRAKHSTVHPIIHFLKDIVTNNDKSTKDLTIGIFLDLSKAFDTISHEILLYKLEYYGIRGIANEWFKSYLTDRKQYTEFLNTESATCNIKFGVPQASILGPLLFLIYLNDLPNSTNLNVLSFADDTTVHASGSNLNELVRKINNELNKIQEWLCENKLSLNINKTNFMVFSPKSYLNENIDLKINGINIRQCGYLRDQNTIKFLGVYLDEQLTWKLHIDHISNNIAKSLYTLNKVKNILPVAALRSIYFALIHIHLSYGILAWGNSTSVNKLFKLQKRAVRIIMHMPYRAHTDPLFKSLNILKIHDLYKLQVSLFAHDYVNNRLPNSFHQFYPNPRISEVETRSMNSLRLYIPRARTNFSNCSIYMLVPKMWNQIELNIRCIISRNIFIHSLKKNMTNSYKEVVSCSNPECRQCSR